MSLRERNKQLKRDAILAAARDLVKAGGADNMTMRELAKNAQVGHVTPYSLFGSKNQIFIALLKEPLENLYTLFFESQISVGEPMEMLFSFPEKMKEMYLPEETYYRSLIGAVAKSGDNTATQEFMESARRFISPLAQLAVSKGVLSPSMDIDVLTNQILMTPMGYLVLWANEDMTADEYAYQVMYTYALTLMRYCTKEYIPEIQGRLDDFDKEYVQLEKARIKRLADQEQSSD